MKKPTMSIWLTVITLFIGALTARELYLLPDGDAHAYFFDVGQGDSALVISPSGKQIIIDGGPNLAALEAVGEVMPFFDRTIDLLVLSHPNADHLTAFPELLKRYKIERILFSGVAYDMGRYEAMLHEIKEQNIPIILADPKQDIDMGDGLTLDVLWPELGLFGKTVDYDVNDTSVMIKAVHNGTSVLFTGDIEQAAESDLLALGSDLSATILKVAHHGSKTSSSTGFLLAVDPELAVISVGKENSFGHPSPEVIERFKALGIPVRLTSEEGTISLSF